MAKKPAKNAQIVEAPAPVETDGPVTGLGETLPQIEAKVRDAMLKLVPHLRKDAIVNDAFEAAYQYGLVEKRRRKLARRSK